MRTSKQAQEKETVAFMIRYYCQKYHGKTLCPQCEEVLVYAHHRIDKCPFMETKTFCSTCKVHCYNIEKREEIRKIMRYSGPRMLFHRPLMALKHIYIERKEKRL